MTAYYNEFDPKAAAWLRELIRCGLIADGVVDERSILDVQPADLAGFTQCHFFAGVGGWSLALRLAGWPDNRPVWSGSPPCQPFSAAGRPDTLFGEQVASAAVFGKATGRSGKSVEGQAPLEWAWLDDLSDRLEAAQYAVGASDIPAAGVGAAHIRQRTFFGACRLADADNQGPQGRGGMFERAGERAVGSGGMGGGMANPLHAGRPEWRPLAGSGSAAGGREFGGRPDAPDLGWPSADWLFCRDGKWRPVEPGTFPLAHGVPARVGRLRGYGNAIVPQAATEFIKAFDAASAECFRLNDMSEMTTDNGVFG